MDRVLILGCGFTGCRLARSLLARNIGLTVTTRNPSRLQWIADAGGEVLALDLSNHESAGRLRQAVRSETRVLHSIPPVPTPAGVIDPTPRLLHALHALERRASRIVYLSTTGVYGAAREVDEHTLPAPRTGRETLRVSAEQSVAAAFRSHLILRPAAIYGPGRGVQAAMQAGTFHLPGDGRKYVSRIHVQDLASLAEAALFSEVTGAFPVADDDPCTSREIAEFCARLLNLPMPGGVPAEEVGETRRADRRVDGSAIRRALGVELLYPSYRVGIPACLAVDEF
ncbi:MAG: NAD-dependent epimerase/dehydratase family protein [Acidobacteriota bacterium]|nr:NAD-dependent epimerase/dehydratase family protein [Acidobacteriota bacterium]